MSGLIRSYPRLGWMFLITAFSVAGIPPLSGFIGKILITEGAFRVGYYWLGGLGLLASLMVIYSMLKIFMNVFWGYPDDLESNPRISVRGLLRPMALLTALTIFLGLGAQGLYGVVDQAVQGLMDPSLYIAAVLDGKLP
jgi:multicomponent Na+:H+ antiporter subunit D